MLFENPNAKLFPAFNIPPPVRLSGALGGLEVVDGGLVGGELAAHVLSAQAAAHAAATAHQQQQQIAVQQIKTSPSSGRSTPVASTAGTTSPSPSKLFVGGLSWQTSSEKLREYFAMFGPVTDVLIMKDPVTQLLLECGLVRPTSAGFFTLLPLARRALTKLENIITNCLDNVGAQRINLPCLTTAKLWKMSGRLEDIGPELINVEDRHGKKYILAPTHEEAIADILVDASPISYKQLPFTLYQVGNKYRDEHRPKHGLLRAREFNMLDAYSFHSSNECATKSYDIMTQAYKDIFRVLDLPVSRVEAPSGDMGGSLSHEWQLPALAGEDCLSVCPSCSHESLDEDSCVKCGSKVNRVNSIEVGHTFVLGTRYSEPLKANFVGPKSTQPIHMGCFGIGITRLLAGSIEALSTETSIRWPKAIAPYTAIIIGPKEGSKEWSSHDFSKTLALAEMLEQNGLNNDVLIDDRHNLTIGKRLMMADRMGYSYTIVCGASAAGTPPRYEVHEGGVPRVLTEGELLALVKGDAGDASVQCRG